MKKRCLFTQSIIIFFSLLMAMSSFAQQKTSAKNFNRYCVFKYSDGSPVTLRSLSELDDLEITDSAHPYNAAWAVSLKNDSVKIHSTWPGHFIIYFAGKEMGRFKVWEKNGKLISDLPSILRLPFYYFVSAPPHSKIMTYSRDGKVSATYKTDATGKLFLTRKPDGDHEAFIACFFPGNFPEIKSFNQWSPESLKRLKNHILQFSPPKKAPKVIPGDIRPSQYNQTVVHNLKEDLYYKIIKTEIFSSHKNILWLAVYHAKTHTATLSNIPVNKNPVNAAFALYLDESGKPVILVSQQDPKTYKYSSTFYTVSPDGNFQKIKTPYPRYKFHGFYIEGSRCIIPTYEGIAMEPGSHTFRVVCTRKNGEEVVSTENFEVVFHPKGKNLWLLKKTGEPLDTNNLYLPDGITGESQIALLGDLKKCTLSVDGNAPFPYSYEDEGALKSIAFSDWDSEEAKQKALANVPVHAGKEPDAPGGWDRSFPFFPGTINNTWPLNLWEGPYAQLKYKIRQVSGRYPTRDEALKYCRQPRQQSGKYLCYKEKIVNVCPSYQIFSVANGKTIMDTASLYCGKPEPPAAESHQIVISVYAAGYRAKTFSLNKTNLELSDIRLNGEITDGEGHPVNGAKIILVGFNKSLITKADGKYRLEAKAQGKHPLVKTLNIRLEPLKFTLSNETLGNYAPDKYFGLVSDGFTTLKLHVKTDGIDTASLTVEPPTLGNFVPVKGTDKLLVLDKIGEGDMEYIPPEYLKNSFLNQKLDIKKETKGVHGLSGNIWAADVPITISYRDKDGNPGSFIFHIQVCRPPVMLIHGFTGDETTWEHLATQLRHDKYDAILREYYKGPVDESTIERQAQKLGAYIQELRQAYLKNGIIQNRVDIVAHSMGGLISRYYISQMAKYGKTAGIYIPYNVKLSKTALAEQRFQKPVILNDVRKLIMVGTPNHGASFLDEQIGALQALFSKEHQLANSELRYDSPFLAKLNAGESEGRHLDPLVQYALIYGMRRRSKLYPLDAVFSPLATAQRTLAPDDGVVTTQSAELNGVASYPFPISDKNNGYGYIHSPAIAAFCPGDASITKDTLVFNKIEVLLQENIPRLPLQNAESRIINAGGQVLFRYYGNQNWIPVPTPLTYLHPKKLKYNFCQIKTEEGSATLGFFLNGHHWGSLNIRPHSVVFYDFASPEYVRFYLQQGKARFRSKKQTGGGFEVVMGNKTGNKWYAFNPKARVKDLNTDFIVEQDSLIQVHSLSGKVVLSVLPKAGKPVAKTITSRQGFLLSGANTLKADPLPDSGWWSVADTAFLPDYIYDTSRFLLPPNAVSVSLSNSYLPVSGFTTMKIFTEKPSTDSIRKKYSVKIVLVNDTLLPFITITNPNGETDSTGNYQTEITFREPKPGDYKTLFDLPLQARFNITLYRHHSDTLVFQKDTTLPLGITLLTGKTLGPGNNPRQQPPPQLNQIIYQMAAESYPDGRFALLFNTTAYKKNQKQLEKLSRSGQAAPGERNFEHYFLQWPASAMFPLTYRLDNVKNGFIPGNKMVLGINGAIDLLSPPEQEARVKELMRRFIRQMALRAPDRNRLLNKTDSMNFQYGAIVDTLQWDFSQNSLLIPADNRKFWNLNSQNRSTVYTRLLRMMAKFLQKNLFSPYLPCAKLHNETIQPWFDPGVFRDFSDAGTDFFQYLLDNFLRYKADGFTNQSIYYQPPDTHAFHEQTHFFIKFYADRCQKNPAKVFSDFLFTQMLYAGISGSKCPAANLFQWLATKHATYRSQYIVATGDPYPVAQNAGLLKKKTGILLIPAGHPATGIIKAGGTILSDFSHIPALSLGDTTTLKIEKGKFLIQFLNKGPASVIETGPGAVFKIDTDKRLLLLSGHFLFRDSIPFHTRLARGIPGSSLFTLTVDPKHTVLNVFEGRVEIKNEKADRMAQAGETIFMSKGGSIKKPKPIKEAAPPPPPPEIGYPFQFIRQ